MLFLVLQARDRVAGQGCRGDYHWVISLNHSSSKLKRLFLAGARELDF